MSKWKQVLAGIGLLAALAGFLVWKNWHDRYVWPRQPPGHMQVLPPADRAGWPSQPAPWKTETVEVTIATPDGLKTTNITYFVNSLGLRLVRIEPGTFWMGLTADQMRIIRSVKLQGHPVTISRPYFLSAYEVTNQQYEQFNPQHRRPSYQRGADGDDHPVEPVTWRDAQLFCRWLSQKEGRLYRLPTEAEWEYACKAGTTTRTYWGDNVWDRNLANVGGLKKDKETWAEDNWVYTAPVGNFPANPWGLYDMIGNSWEWVQNWYADYTPEPQVDPQGPTTGHMRVAKSPSWSTRTRHVKSAARDGNNPADLHDVRSFRVLCEAQ